MNLTRTERLLAAKKKLKEFQMSKMMQQNQSPDQQSSQHPSKKYIPGVSYNGRPLEEFYANHYPERLNSLGAEAEKVMFPGVPNQTTESLENSAGSNSTNGGENWNKLETSPGRESSRAQSPSKTILEAAATQNPGGQEEYHSAQPLVEGATDSVKPESNLDREQVPECSLFQNTPAQDFPVTQSALQEVQETQLNDAAAEKTVQCDPGKLESFPVQKEHLLEMANAVENALINSDASDPLESELSYRNQFLNSYLEEQKKIVNELHLEISSYRSRVSELEAKLSSREAEFEAQLAREVKPLKEQLQLHAQTTGILIAERAELSASLAQTQQSARRTCEEIEELSGKLKQSQTQVSELEKEVSTLRSLNEELRKSNQQQRSELDQVQEKMHTLKTEKEESSLEASELHQKLNLWKTELVSVRQELQEKTALLSLSELRLQQMQEPSDNGLDERTRRLQEELEETRHNLKTVTEEKEFLAQQYQNYVKYLDAKETRMASSAATVEQEHVQRIQELERQLQEQLNEAERRRKDDEEERRRKQENGETGKEDTDDQRMDEELRERLEQLRRKVAELTEERSDLMNRLESKQQEAEELRGELNRVKEEGQEQCGEVSRLAKALESEQLGASRAVSQNQQLKQQLTDMENAFVALCNDKLELTEQLQAERSIGRKLNAKLNSVEIELEKCREEVKEAEAALKELEKERLQHAQLADQMQHYQVQGQHAQTYQMELQNALTKIDRMEKERQQLAEKLEKEKLEVTERLEKEKQELLGKLQSVGEGKQELEEKQEPGDKTEVEKDTVEHSETLSPEKEANSMEHPPEECTQQVDHCVGMTDAMKKLQDRFKDTMERVAELTEEKQELEHLVMQLQSETETIGEYIILYQKQRAILEGRAKKKDQALRQLLDQRNQLQEQLHRLKLHVGDFLRKEVIKTEKNEVVATQPSAEGVVEPLLEETSETPEEQSVKEKSVSELLDLLTEIKDCKDSFMFSSNFHPCPWCSGKLQTV